MAEKKERKKRERDGDQDDGRVGQIYEVNEEERGEWGEEEIWMDNEDLDPAMVKEGRREEVEFMIDKLDMFEFWKTIM